MLREARAQEVTPRTGIRFEGFFFDQQPARQRRGGLRISRGRIMTNIQSTAVPSPQIGGLAPADINAAVIAAMDGEAASICRSAGRMALLFPEHAESLFGAASHVAAVVQQIADGGS
ncbi:hypothetical protein [Azospirillum himalayense]|uniref:Uncharacterized protein n=1 Tax=Azospirillum himalayense TaxID=654847 RepID=A0ABW0GAZ3_9PROT